MILPIPKMIVDLILDSEVKERCSGWLIWQKTYCYFLQRCNVQNVVEDWGLKLIGEIVCWSDFEMKMSYL